MKNQLRSLVVFQETKSDAHKIQEDESNIDGESDNETNTTNNSMMTDSKACISQGLFSFCLNYFVKNDLRKTLKHTKAKV